MNMRTIKYFCTLCAILLISIVFSTGCNQKSNATQEKTTGKLEITSSPSDCEIFILGKSKGNTEKTFELTPGLYVIKAAREGYVTSYKPVQIKAGTVAQLSLNLAEATSLALFTSSPSGATVFIDGVEAGMTPCLISDIKTGLHNATFKLPRHSTEVKTWNATDSGSETIEVKLSSNTGNLKITSDPDGARITINDKPYGTTPFDEPFDVGEYDVKIESDNNEPYAKKIIVLRDKDTVVDVKLSLLPGSLDLTSDPDGAKIVIYDAEGNMVRGGATPLKIDSLKAGVYKITAEASGRDRETLDVTVVAGAPTKEHIKLSSNTGGIDLVTHPAGVSIYVNGRLRGTTEPDDTDPERSKTFSLTGLAAGKYRVDYVHRRAIPAKKISRDYVVKKGETIRVAPVTLWVSNARIVLKNGRVYEGRIIDTAENAETVNFQPEPGVGTSYKRSEIDSIVWLSTADTAAKGNGSIELEINQPGTIVTVDGKRHGIVKASSDSPYTAEKYLIGDLEAGKHKIEFSHRRADKKVVLEYTVKNEDTLKPEPVFIWAQNVYVELKNGKKYEARLVEQTDNSLVIEPEAGLKLTFKLADVEKLTPLK